MANIIERLTRYFVADWQDKEGPYEIPSFTGYVRSALYLFIILLVYNTIDALYLNESFLINSINFLENGLIVILLFYLKYSGKKKTTGFLLMAIGYVTTIIAIYNSGGIFSFDLLWLIFSVVTLFLFVNLRLGILFSVSNVLIVSFLYYQNLKGKDNFALKSIQSDGFYEYIAFVLLQLLFTLLLVYFVRALQKSNYEIKKLNEEKVQSLSTIIEEKTQENLIIRHQVVKDFHDIMGNKLASISSISQMLQLKANIADQASKEQLLLIHKLSQELYENTKDFIWSMNLKHHNLFYVGMYMCNFGERLFKYSSISFSNDPIPEEYEILHLSQEVSSQLVLIMKEAFTNILVHSKSTDAHLSIKLNHNEIVIRISDRGVGFNFNEIARLSGLENMIERAKQISANCSITSEIDKGTIIQINLPIHEERHTY